MRRLILCVASALLVGASGCAKPDTTPETKVATTDGKVSAVFPHAPKETKEGEDVTYAYESRDGRTAYLLSPTLVDGAFDLDDEAHVKKTLVDSRTATLTEIKGKLLVSKEIALGRYRGQSFDAETAEGIYRARLFMTEKYFVQIVVLGPRRIVDGPEAAKFLDSLKLEE